MHLTAYNVHSILIYSTAQKEASGFLGQGEFRFNFSCPHSISLGQPCGKIIIRARGQSLLLLRSKLRS